MERDVIAVRVGDKKKEIVFVFDHSYEAFALSGLAANGLGRTHVFPLKLHLDLPYYTSWACLLSLSTNADRNKERDRGLSRFGHDRDCREDG